MVDAQNLAWKLHHVLTGRAADPETLLNSYSEERDPIAADILQMSSNLTRFITSDSWILDFVRKRIVPIVLGTVTGQTKMRAGMLQTAINYMGRGPLFKDTFLPQSAQDAAMIKPGQHMPDTGLLHSIDPELATESKTLYDLLRLTKSHFAVFFITTCMLNKNDLIPPFLQIYGITALIICSSSACGQYGMPDQAKG
ncbi:hypothetical protein BZG36_05395 [Bifiguratus adelaidae]|uniref:FAD-binding domain-containing protein n=1 Tax=Bifiguratus adelaidae TaxID=1938954 RepID=A0A261XUB1_9FUNG|nr:hypothetical protein BZG36_05395 [Bifiguratus adelaidae]